MSESTNPNQKGCLSTKSETHREAYIRILQETADGTAVGSDSEREAILSGELILGDYLEGSVVRDANGCVAGSATTGITVAGRLFLQHLQKEEREESKFGRLKKYGLVVFGFIMGIIANLIPDLMKHLFSKP